MIRWIIFFIFLFLFSLFSQEKQIFEEIYFKINGSVLSKLDVEEALSMNKKLTQVGISLPTSRNEILSNMITQVLIEQEINRQGTFISELDILNQVKLIAKNNNIGKVEDLKEMFSKQEIRWEYFLYIQKGLMARQYLNQFLPPSESPTDNEVKNYYDNHKNKFIKNRIIETDQIFMRREDNLTFSEISQLESLAKEVTQKARDKNNFKALVREYSDSPVSTDWKIKEDFVGDPHLWDHLTLLDEGEISKPLSVANGFFIFKVLSIKLNASLPYEKAKIWIIQDMKNEQLKKSFDQKVSELKESALIEKVHSPYPIPNL